MAQEIVNGITYDVVRIQNPGAGGGGTTDGLTQSQLAATTLKVVSDAPLSITSATPLAITGATTTTITGGDVGLNTQLAIEDPRGFGAMIEAATAPFQVKRIPGTAAGTFLNNGDVNLAPLGTVGSAGDYLRSIDVEVKTMAAGGKAAIFVWELSDEVFAQNTGASVGSAITNTTSQTFTHGANLSAAANALADRVILYEYVPTGGQKQWAASRIVSHGAISTTAVSLVLEDTPEAGAAPTKWIILGPRARRYMEPGRAEGRHIIDVRRTALTGGFVVFVGNGIVSADFYGVFSG